MKHPLEKFIRMEVLAMIAGLFIGVLAWITGWVLFLFLACYLFIGSMFSHALILLHTRRGSDGIKQALRAMLLFLFITSLFFYLK
ncbi:hypothetical protein [Oceanobacillus locisalsi]|uniref:Uncharacterized protein n=1 Tax=Oceanobacillus locisalsi TaxID=546107 RepID=A0ABW3NE45_9BACI